MHDVCEARHSNAAEQDVTSPNLRDFWRGRFLKSRRGALGGDYAYPRCPEDVLELLERRISDKVQERVQRRLNTLYAAIAAGGLIVGGVSLYSLAQQATQSIMHNEVRPAAQKAQEKLSEVEKILIRAELQVEEADKVLQRTNAMAVAAEEKADHALARTEQTVDRMKQDLDSLSATTGGLQARTNDQLKTLRDAFADLATLSDLNADVNALTQQVRTLDGGLQALAQNVSGMSPLDKEELDEVSSSLDPIAHSLQIRDQQLQRNGRLTVFFQFADMSEPLARKVSSQLRRKRYVVPGEARETMDRGLREVRYFAEEDEAKAEQLAADTAAALEAIGHRGMAVEVRPVVTWQGRKPRSHTLELWLSLPEVAASAKLLSSPS